MLGQINLTDSSLSRCWVEFGSLAVSGSGLAVLEQVEVEAGEVFLQVPMMAVPCLTTEGCAWGDHH